MGFTAIPLPVIVKSGLHVVGDFVAEIASGAISIGEVITNISGQPVMVSGQHIHVESGVHVVGDFSTVESGLGVVVQSGIGVVGDFSTTVESGLHVVVGSGVHVVGDFTAEVSVSGQPVTISGQSVVVGSGLGVVGDFTTTIDSGLGVVVQSGIGVVGDFTTEVASGLYVIEGPATEIKTGNIRTLATASGGEVLHSGSILALEVMALDTNACDIYLGGINNRPYSGFGYPLQAGATKNMTINDFGALYLFPACSGDQVGFIGII